MYIHCMYYRKDLAALYSGSAHQLQRDSLQLLGNDRLTSVASITIQMTFLKKPSRAVCYIGLQGVTGQRPPDPDKSSEQETR